MGQAAEPAVSELVEAVPEEEPELLDEEPPDVELDEFDEDESPDEELPEESEDELSDVADSLEVEAPARLSVR